VVSGFMSFFNAHKDEAPDEASARRIVALVRSFAPGFDVGR